MAKKPCPITRKHFAEHAKPILVRIGDTLLTADVNREFSSKSFGFNANTKMTLDVGGTPVEFQVGLNITAIGSKDLPDAGVAV